MSTENKLAAIPKDQLILELLQELAARVAKLEKKDESAQVGDPTAREPQLGDSQNNGVATVDQPNTAESAPGSSEVEDGDALCRTCGELPSQSCRCIEVPYGYLLEGETPSENMKTMQERVDELETSEQGRGHLIRLKRLGIAAVPADGRLGLTNFWSLTSSSGLEQTIDFIGEIFEKGGYFTVTDFDRHGTYMAYGDAKPLTGKFGRSSESSAPFFSVPSMRTKSDTQFVAPWRRLV